jgi:hypothetical protein
MNRRTFVKSSLAAGAVGLGAGGFLFIRRNQARAAVQAGMLTDALPALTDQSLDQLKTLPVQAREEIRRYFHGKCLNVQSFVGHICSSAFQEQLAGCHTPEERETCFMLAFCGRVTSEVEILNRVETIAAEVGRDLDTAWASYCTQLSGKWTTRISQYGAPLAAAALTDRVSGVIRSELARAVKLATTKTQAPFRRTIAEIGASAILLLPVTRLGKAGVIMSVPVFLLLAAKHLWDYVTARLQDRGGDYQAAISGRLALLGQRVGDEFEREIRQRLLDLHTWQQQAVRTTAGALVYERVPLF